jgi:FlaA1/EpsC-like NDP-sugar epimerase
MKQHLAPWLTRSGQLVLSLLLDISIVLLSYIVALSLKFDGDVPGESWRQLIWAGPLIAFAYILAYQVLGVYRTAWQYGSIRDALLLAVAVGIVTAGVLTVNVLLPKRPIPLSVNVISAAFIFLFHAMARVMPRLWATAGFAGAPERPAQRVLIVGASESGQRLVGELQSNRSQPYRAVGFVDDDEGLKGKRVHGVPVLGNRYDIPAAIERQKVDLVAIALPPERAPRLQEVLALCEPSKVPVRLVPSGTEVMEGSAQRGELREITMEDLLAREPVDVDAAACRATIAGRVVLITGAAGSIGAELARRVLAFKPAALHLLDMSETGLNDLRVELAQRAGGNLPIKPVLGSITDRQRLQDLFEATRPQVVFHLAAYKHVTMVEENPDQGFETNVLGTLNIFEAAQAVQTEQVVFLSSHTAVNPTSVYGATKRVGELLVTSLTGRTRFCGVRLTNVIDTRGTVLAAFARQIERGGPVRVTDPGVARYFLTVNEVAGLVIQAAALTRGGEVFLLDIGEETRIDDLARRLIRSHGMEPEKDIEIEYVGLREGEKLRESLAGEYETLEPTSHARIQRAVSSRRYSGPELVAAIRELEVDRRRRTGNLPAKLHALARFDQAAVAEPQALEAPQEP